jgi:hypothetical protein
MTSERRQAPRYPLIAKIGQEKGEGITRDLSTSGVFFLSDAGYAVGEAIGFWLELEDRDHELPLRVDCKGRVVRVEPAEGRWGIAVSMTSIGFGMQRWEDGRQGDAR